MSTRPFGAGKASTRGAAMKRLLFGVCLVSLACGRTDLSFRQRSVDDGGVLHATDPLQGVWERDEDVPGLFLNRQFSFTDGAWKTQLRIGYNHEDGRQIDEGTYVVEGSLVEMKTTASSCQSLAPVTNFVATFERHGDKMTMLWQSDPASALPAETLYLSRIASLSNLGVPGCNVITSGNFYVFLPNDVTPVL
jgi:hypothetical protein